MKKKKRNQEFRDGFKRWSEEEKKSMATIEAEGVKKRVKFLNTYILERLPGRTLQSIKGSRRKKAYKELVKQLLRVPPTLSSQRTRVGRPEEYQKAILKVMASITSTSAQLPVAWKLPSLSALADPKISPEDFSKKVEEWLEAVFRASINRN